MVNMKKAVEFKNVSFSYGENSDFVLKNSDFFLEYGELSLLAGFSGSGKSTVLSILTGIIPNLVNGKLEGKIFVDGEDISFKKINSICKKVALVMQNAEIQIIHESVEDEIMKSLLEWKISPLKNKKWKSGLKTPAR